MAARGIRPGGVAEKRGKIHIFERSLPYEPFQIAGLRVKKRNPPPLGGVSLFMLPPVARAFGAEAAPL